MLSRICDRQPAGVHGRLRARLDLELVRLGGELRAMDPAITRQRLVVERHERDLAELGSAPPRRHTRGRQRAEVTRMTHLDDLYQRQRDVAEAELARLLAHRARVVDETIGRMCRHVVVAHGSVPDDLIQYLRRVAALVEPLAGPAGDA